MRLIIKSMDGRTSTDLEVSRCLYVEKLREMLEETFEVPKTRLNLYYKGKQLLNGLRLYEYHINFDDVVQVQVIPELNDESNSSNKENDKAKDSNSDVPVEDNYLDWVVTHTDYYKVGDAVDMYDPEGNGWLEGRIQKIKSECAEEGQNDYIYCISREGYENNDKINIKEDCIRPRSYHLLSIADINVDDRVLVNYNAEDEKEIGNWCEAVVKHKEDARRKKTLKADIYISREVPPLEDRMVSLTSYVYRLESPILINERSAELVKWMESTSRARPACLHCGDVDAVNCKICCCSVCGGKQDPDKQPMCDECGLFFHITCVNPPLEKVPEEDDWYCPGCKNDATEVVGKGEKLKESKRTKNMPSMSGNCTRDWGKGMACVGHRVTCSIVPPNHFGPIPGVPVGSMWCYRVQVGEAGVHRPQISGIHGRSGEGAYSIVFSGGYPEDEDNGDEFLYTGSGGRDLSGNKRTAEQTSDQKLTACNQSLALNCAAKFDNVKGASAGANWKKGKPVRVVRSAKGRKHSKYCPKEGQRYDGIYKVCKYWPEKGKSGFIVWRYLFRRDDPAPAPWTKAGKEKIAELGLELKRINGDKTKRNVQRKRSYASDDDDGDTKAKRVLCDTDKKGTDEKEVAYKLAPKVMKLIAKDTVNAKAWEEVLAVVERGQQAVADKVKENFKCSCCQDLVIKPVSLPCSHFFCERCLSRFISLNYQFCQLCRADLKGTPMNVNTTLVSILQQMFPLYDK